MTRWRLDDLCGRLLEASRSGGDKWEVVNIPALINGDMARKFYIIAKNYPMAPEPVMPKAVEVEGFDQPVVSFSPRRFPVKELLRSKANMTAQDWNALYMGDPQEEEMNVDARDASVVLVDLLFEIPGPLVALLDQLELATGADRALDARELQALARRRDLGGRDRCTGGPAHELVPTVTVESGSVSECEGRSADRLPALQVRLTGALLCQRRGGEVDVVGVHVGLLGLFSARLTCGPPGGGFDLVSQFAGGSRRRRRPARWRPGAGTPCAAGH
jgi:hypothetical protein